MQHKVAYGIHPENIREFVSVQDVSLGLAHLSIAHQKPWMAEDLLRKRLPEGHQENGPVDGVEADDVFPDQVKVRRPVSVVRIRRSVGVVACEGDIVAQGIQPHVDDVLRVEIHRDSPGK